MKKGIKKLIAAITLVAMLVPSVSYGAAMNYGSTILWDGEYYYSYSQPYDKISIIYTGGLMGDLIGQSDEGSMASAMTKIKDLRKAFPDSYLLDGGYFTEGKTPYGTQMDQSFGLKALEVMAYDGALLGNRELELENLYKILNSAIKDAEKGWGKVIYPRIFAANLDLAKGENKKLKSAIEKLGVEKQYAVISKYGSKLAVFGLVDGKDTLDSAKEAKKIVKAIKEEEPYVDGILCLYNGDDPESIAKATSSINLIIATDQEKFDKTQDTAVEDVETAKVGKTYIVNTLGKTSIGQIVLTKEADQKLKLESCESYKLDETIEKAQAIKELYKQYQDAADESYFAQYGISSKKTIATSKQKLSLPKGQGNSSLGDLIGDSYMYAAQKYGKGKDKVATAFFAAGTITEALKSGSLKARDVYGIFTHEKGIDQIAGCDLVDVYLSGAELKILAEIDASIAEDNKDVRLFGSGLIYEYNPSRFYRNRVSDVFVKVDGKKTKVEDRELYRVVTDLKTIELIEDADKAPFGLMDIEYKDKDGNPIEDLNKAIIKVKGQNMKQWQALYKYVDDKGISKKYAKASNSKTKNDDGSLKAIFAKPGKVFVVTMLGGIIAIALVILLICIVISIIRRALGIRTSSFIKQARKANKQKSIFSHRRNRYTRNMKYRKERRFGRRR